MKRKCWYSLFALSLFFLISCQSEAEVPEGYYQFETKQVEATINQVSFAPDLPQYLPMPIEFIISDPYLITGTNEEAIDISFYSRENDLLTFQVTEGTFAISRDAEDIDIDSTTRAYYDDNGFAKVLMWENNGLCYKLEFRSSVIGDAQPSHPVSKEDLIKVAQSTHL